VIDLWAKINIGNKLLAFYQSSDAVCEDPRTDFRGGGLLSLKCLSASQSFGPTAMGRGEVKLNSNEDLDDQCQFVRASKRKGAATAYSEKRLVIWRYLHDSTSFLSQISDSLKKCLDLVRLSRNVPLTLRFKQLHPRPRVARLIRESRGEGPLGCRLLARDLRDWLHSRPRQHLLMMERNGISISFLKPSDWREQFLVPARIVLKMCFISLYLEMASDLI